MRTSIVGAAVLLLAWSALLFGVLLRGQMVTLEVVMRRQHYLQASHRRTFALGFGSFPIIFSITLFFWFKDPFFYWQFAMVALGLGAKEFLRWKRDGPEHAPTAADYRFILRGSKGPIEEREPAQLYARACEVGWPGACGRQ